MKKKIRDLELKINNPKKGLPDEIFLFLGRISPLINVDLLIKNKNNETLLTWRQKEESFKAGWHIPGGIIRFKETIDSRLNQVAKNELNTLLKKNNKFIAVNEIMLKQKNRSHFISLLYRCYLKKMPDLNLKYLGKKKPKIGQWKWFKSCPNNLLKPHIIYKKYINS